MLLNSVSPFAFALAAYLGAAAPPGGAVDKALLGYWVDNAGKEDLEFLADGTLVLHSKSMTVTAKYQIIEPGRLLMELLILGTPTAATLRYRLQGDHLAVQDEDTPRHAKQYQRRGGAHPEGGHAPKTSQPVGPSPPTTPDHDVPAPTKSLTPVLPSTLTEQQAQAAVRWAEAKLGTTYNSTQTYEKQGEDRGFYYSCVAFAQCAYLDTGYPLRLGPWPTAANAASALKNELRVEDPPQAGAWAFYEWKSDGHVGLGAGDGMVIHAYTDLKTGTATIRKDPYNQIPGVQYIGWTWPRGPYQQLAAPLSPGDGAAPGPVAGTATPTLQWEAVQGATRYAIAISKAPYGSASVVHRAQPTGTSYTVPKGVLEAGCAYRWNMQAFVGDRWSAVSPTLYFRTPAK